MIPSKPVRKGPGVNVSPVGKSSGGSIPMPNKRTATPFGTVDKSIYKRTTAPISPTSSPVNDKDGGKALRTGNSGAVRLPSGVSGGE